MLSDRALLVVASTQEVNMIMEPDGKVCLVTELYWYWHQFKKRKKNIKHRQDKTCKVNIRKLLSVAKKKFSLFCVIFQN